MLAELVPCLLPGTSAASPQFTLCELYRPIILLCALQMAGLNLPIHASILLHSDKVLYMQQGGGHHQQDRNGSQGGGPGGGGSAAARTQATAGSLSSSSSGAGQL